MELEIFKLTNMILLKRLQSLIKDIDSTYYKLVPIKTFKVYNTVVKNKTTKVDSAISELLKGGTLEDLPSIHCENIWGTRKKYYILEIVESMGILVYNVNSGKAVYGFNQILSLEDKIKVVNLLSNHKLIQS